MFLYSIVNGVRRGWIDGNEFGDVIDAAWKFISGSVLADGTVRDVVIGTGVQVPVLKLFFFCCRR